MDVRTTQRTVAGQVVLAIDGTVDLAALPALHDALQRLVGQPGSPTPIAVDLDGTTVLDDAALGLLLGAAARARSRGRAFSIVCADERLRQRLADTRLDQVVDVTTTLGGSVPDRSSRLS